VDPQTWNSRHKIAGKHGVLLMLAVALLKSTSESGKTATITLRDIE